jgi:hypothetical protein
MDLLAVQAQPLDHGIPDLRHLTGQVRQPQPSMRHLDSEFLLHQALDRVHDLVHGVRAEVGDPVCLPVRLWTVLAQEQRTAEVVDVRQRPHVSPAANDWCDTFPDHCEECRLTLGLVGSVEPGRPHDHRLQPSALLHFLHDPLHQHL